jgi:hypothetical protein
MRTIGLRDLKLAFERAGLPYSPPEPDHLSRRDRDHLSGRNEDHLSRRDRDLSADHLSGHSDPHPDLHSDQDIHPNIPAELLISVPDPPRAQWVAPYHREPVVKIAWDYDPWSKDRLN